MLMVAPEVRPNIALCPSPAPSSQSSCEKHEVVQCMRKDKDTRQQQVYTRTGKPQGNLQPVSRLCLRAVSARKIFQRSETKVYCREGKAECLSETWSFEALGGHKGQEVAPAEVMGL